MRDIKFRAWIKGEDDGLMIHQGDKSDFTMVSNGGDFSIVVDHEEWLKPNAFEIMQYTGLKDRNGTGNEMCQGDIVFAAGLGFGVVNKNRWGEWGLVINDGFESIHDLMMECDLGSIIGNIHENPELLECEA